VSSRRRELGLRAALGADRRRLAASVAREAVPILVTGVAAGAVLGWWGARVTASLLHEVSPADPLLWLAAGGIVLTSAAIAMVVPCRRACLTSPAEALRDEA
jgi:ABC-type antimicrobial peptide transport system permease subunit